jgi:uncharacterized protein with HEPN domain
MSARPNDDRRVAEIWETCAEIAARMASGVYSEEIVVSPSNKVEEALGEALAYGLQRIGEEASRLSFDAKTIAKLPWDNIAGLRNILSHDYPGISWDQIWSVATDDLPSLRDYCVRYAELHETTIQELVELNHASLRQADAGKENPPTHRWDDR